MFIFGGVCGMFDFFLDVQMSATNLRSKNKIVLDQNL